MLKLISFFVLLSSCSTVKMIQKEPEKLPVMHMTAAVIDLGRSAYLKGCVDGANIHSNSKVSVFEVCKNLAKGYEVELRKILEQQEKKANQ